ncbi:YopX family protein [Enterococcus dispar]|uniref:YopX family protein n=1 Tax=Enterococcus dispar TaxID=44009 RepID=UPI00189EFA08|nr:YopX family protein [Enterococcus dispar]
MIKFRAWDKRMKVMIDVAVLHFAKDGKVNSIEYWKTPSELKSYHVRNLVLMQSTGLKDKNGVEIFEGDVLRVYEIDDIRGESEYTSPVIWKDYGWLVYDTDTDIPLCLLDRDSDWVDKDVEIEVLGNIHANPELLI